MYLLSSFTGLAYFVEITRARH